jgi:hypothetical protein
MATVKNNTSDGEAAAKPEKVRQHVRTLLVKLTEHVKQKSVEGGGPVKADGEEQRSGCVEYV